MRKRIVFVFVMILVLSLFSSCKLIVRDMDVVNARTVLKLGDVSYTRGEIDRLVESEMDMLETSYATYGATLDRTDPAVIADAQEAVLSGLTRQMVLDAKTEELGCQLSDGDIAQLEAEAETEFAANVDFFKNYFVSADASEETIIQSMASFGYPSTVEATLDMLKAEKEDQLLMETVTADVTVTGEEVQAAYDAGVETQKTNYTEYPAMFKSDYDAGETIYYTPAGFRFVKTIYVPFTEADAAAIKDLNSQITAAASDEAADTSALEDQMDALKVTALSNIQTTVDEIQGKIDAGEDFDALVAQYSQDEAAKEEPVKTSGYLLYDGAYSSFGDGFTEEAMALSAAGDVSLPVITDEGVHFIQFASELTEGATPLENIRETVESQALATKKEQTYMTLIESWIEEADVVVDKKALK